MDTPPSDPARVDPRRNGLLRQVSRANGIVRFLLRSPLHPLVSRRLMLLTYVGAKTGRVYTIPVRYLRLDDGRLMVMSRGTGWSKRVAGREVTLRLAGRDHRTVARTHDRRDEIAALLATYYDQVGTHRAARALVLGLPADRTPTTDEFHAAAERTRIVLFGPFDS